MLTVDIIRSQVLRNSSYYFDANSVGTFIFYLTFSFLEMSGAQFMTSAERLARFMKLRRILKFSDKFSQHQQCTQSLALPEIFLTFSSKISTCTSWMVSEFNFDMIAWRCRLRAGRVRPPDDRPLRSPCDSTVSAARPCVKVPRTGRGFWDGKIEAPATLMDSGSLTHCSHQPLDVCSWCRLLVKKGMLMGLVQRTFYVFFFDLV